MFSSLFSCYFCCGLWQKENIWSGPCFWACFTTELHFSVKSFYLITSILMCAETQKTKPLGLSSFPLLHFQDNSKSYRLLPLPPPSHLCMCVGMCLWVSASAHAVQSASFTRLSVSCRWNFPFMFMPILSFCDIVGSIANTTTQILLNERRKTDQLLLRKASADFSLSYFFLNLSTKHLCIELVLSFSSGWYLISYLSHWGGSEPRKKTLVFSQSGWLCKS